jgi:squalene-hopene/tetraprenyl-beta-curcumene cyclase
MIRTAMVVIGILLGHVASQARAQEAGKFDRDKFERTVSAGINFLRSNQGPDGSFSGHAGTGVTSLAVTAMLKSGVPASDPAVQKGLEYLEKHVKETGAIHADGSTHKNYETSLAMLAFIEARKGEEFKKILADADKFVRDLQWDEGEDVSESDTRYGGAGYGSSSRPDLSNTQFFMEALLKNGADKDDPAIQRALIFVSRTQNLESSHNTTKFPALNPDGGFYYTPAAGGQTKAETLPNGGLRSYASMTYAGLKSFLYAGVDANDPRVKAAYKWAQDHYGLDSNPGVGAQGLYYYYHVFAKALDAVGNDVIVDSSGNEHHWRVDLLNELASRQNKDGSWTNKGSDRWMENDPNLVTAYSLLALSACNEEKQK